MASPDAEFADSRRQELLKDLSKVLDSDVPPTVWACLWLSDVEMLESIVEDAKTLMKRRFRVLLSTFHEIEASIRIVPLWTQRKRVISAAPQKRNSDGQEDLSRSKPQRNQCHQRDQRKCVLTKAGEPNEVAHIYPFSLRTENNDAEKPRPSFWEALRFFWSEERVDAWYNAVFTEGRIEVCQNLMCLAPSAHQYWTRAYFALKPISLSDDKKHLEMEFFWLSSNPHVPAVKIMNTPSLSAMKDHGPNLAKLWNHETDEKIRSGYKVSLDTDDPESRPLPDLRLLEMQWILHRVTAMSGAAEVQDDFHSNSDDDSEDAEVAYDWEEDYEIAEQDDMEERF